MRFSTRSRYGLRAMIELGRLYGGPPVTLETIALRQRLSVKYLFRLLTTLRAAELIRSVRGKAGGYVLSRPPAEITLGQIIRALEGPVSLVDCVTNARACRRSDDCTARTAWQNVARAVDQALDGISLGSLVTQDFRAERGRARDDRRVGLSPVRPARTARRTRPRSAATSR